MIKALTGKASRAAKLSTARYNIFEGAVRSGKTVASIFAWFEYVRHGPAGNLAMIGKTERTLKRNVIDPIIEMVGTKRARYVAGAGELYLFGRRIYITGANNVEAVSKIQGLTLAGAYGDEVSTWPKTLWEMLGTRLSVPGARFMGTCNPESPVHWLKEEIDRATMWIMHDGCTSKHHAADPLDLHRFSFLIDDNPHLSPDFVANLKAQYKGLFFRRYILGLWVPAEGAIFDMFDPDDHVKPTIPRIERWLGLAVDHGTRNPTHAGMLGLGSDRRLHLVSEWRWDSVKQRRQLSNVDLSKQIRQWASEIPVPGSQLAGIMPERVIVDPSAADFRVQLHNDGWPSIVASNDVLPGIRTVQSLFARDLLHIHESAQELIRELQGYSWDDKAAEKGLDEPLKVADHGPDMLRYGCYTTRGQWRESLRHILHAN